MLQGAGSVTEGLAVELLGLVAAPAPASVPVVVAQALPAVVTPRRQLVQSDDGGPRLATAARVQKWEWIAGCKRRNGPLHVDHESAAAWLLSRVQP